MNMPGKRIVFTSLTVLFLGYFLYLPLPSEMKSRGKIRFISINVDIGMFISSLVERVSGKPAVETFHGISVLSFEAVYQNYPELQVDNLVWDGIPVRVYKPKAVVGLSPGVVYFHGGGWVANSIEVVEPMLIDMSLQARVIVVAVRFRYAFQSPYPGPFEDCVKATAYLLQNGEEFGVDVKRLAVMGESAGGNLAAAVALRLSEEDPAVMAPIKLQVLICPVLQALSFNTTSYRDNGKGNWHLRKDIMIFFWAAYLGLDLNQDTYSIMAREAHISPRVKRSVYSSYINKTHSDINENYDTKIASKLDDLIVEPFLSPLMANDLSKVPPAYVIAMEFDILRDEVILYAQRLKEAGVKTDLWVIKGETHISIISPFLSRIFGNSDVDRIYGNISEYLKKSL